MPVNLIISPQPSRAERFWRRVTLLAGTVLLAALFLQISFSGAAETSVVAGRVLLPDGKQAAGQAAVWLQKDTPEPISPRADALIDQRGKTFIPHILIVPKGTTVRFPNNDTVFHNVFAFFEAKRFDLGMYPRGATKTVKFDKPGVVAVLCNVHPHMSAYIVVVNTPRYTVADSQGNFRLTDVPAGSYTLYAWQESGARFERKITVPASGSAEKTDALTLTLKR